MTVVEQLMAGGTAHIRERGPVELTVRALSKSSGRTTMCVYSHFGSRETYVQALHGSFAEELLADVDAAAEGGDAGEGSHAGAVVESVDAWARANPGPWRFLVSVDPGVGSSAEARAALMAVLSGRIASGLAADGAPADDLAERADALLAGILGVQALRALTPDDAGPSGGSAGGRAGAESAPGADASGPLDRAWSVIRRALGC